MSITRRINQVQTLKQKFISSLGLPFRDLLPESTIIEVLAAEKITTRHSRQGASTMPTTRARKIPLKLE